MGCGQANALALLAALGHPAASWESTWTAPLRGARRHLDARGAQAELFEADVRSMPFPDGSFDLVLDFGTCYHITDSERASWRSSGPGSRRTAHPRDAALASSSLT